MKPTTRKQRALAASGIALALLLGLELVLRVAGFEHPPVDLPMIVWNPDEDRLMETSTYLFRRDDDTLWSPRPGATVQFAERDRIEEVELINAAGYRGTLLPVERTPGVVRIATLGDSSTFGVGVPYASTYSAQLQRSCEQRQVRAEVLDAGVDGFTLRQGLERYRKFARNFHPDVVIAAFGAVNEHWGSLDGIGDDFKIRTQQQSASDWARVRRALLEHSRVVQLLRDVLQPRWRKRLGDQVVEMRAKARMVATEASLPDWKGERRVNLEQFPALLRELQHEVEQDGARLILVVNPRRRDAETEFPVLPLYSAMVREAAAKQGLQILDARSRFHARLDAGATEDELFIGDLWHPNAAGHRIIAEGLVPLVLDPALNRAADPQSEPAAR